jgi:hypothetical protein
MTNPRWHAMACDCLHIHPFAFIPDPDVTGLICRYRGVLKIASTPCIVNVVASSTAAPKALPLGLTFSMKELYRLRQNTQPLYEVSIGKHDFSVIVITYWESENM